MKVDWDNIDDYANDRKPTWQVHRIIRDLCKAVFELKEQLRDVEPCKAPTLFEEKKGRGRPKASE